MYNMYGQLSIHMLYILSVLSILVQSTHSEAHDLVLYELCHYNMTTVLPDARETPSDKSASLLCMLTMSNHYYLE